MSPETRQVIERAREHPEDLARLVQIAPVVDPQSRQGDARILLSYHKDLRPGGFASARIVSGAP